MLDDDIWDRKRGMYYDRTGREITLREWIDLCGGPGGTPDDRLDAIHVESDYVDDVWVSTVWIGINHRFGPGAPLIFETMVFGGPLAHDQRRYATEDQARLGHAEILAEVRAAAAGEPVRDADKNVIDQIADALLERDD